MKLTTIDEVLTKWGKKIPNKNDDDCIVLVENQISAVRIDGKAFNIFRWLWVAYGNLIASMSWNRQELCQTKNCLKKDHFVFLEVHSKQYVRNRIQKDTIRLENGCINTNFKANQEGYVSITINGIVHGIHRAVIWSKNDEYPTMRDLPGDLEVRHCKNESVYTKFNFDSCSDLVCGNKLCINEEHLKLGTHEENYQDQVVHGTAQIGEHHHSAKLTEETVKKIILSWYPVGHANYKSKKERAIQFNTSYGTIKGIDFGESWTHLPRPPGRVLNKKKRKIKKLTPNQNINYNIARHLLKTKSIENENKCWIWSPRCLKFIQELVSTELYSEHMFLLRWSTKKDCRQRD